MKRGEVGSQVATLHQLLLEQGESVAQAELATAAYGDSTMAAVVAFQAGRGLVPDGVVGPKTQAALRTPGTAFQAPGWMCLVSEARPEVRPVLEAALADLRRPTVEDPGRKNRGRHIDPYGVPGEKWCAAAASSWISAAKPNPLRRMLASSYKWHNAAKAAGWLVTDPQPGDIAAVLRPDFSGHVGLVVHVLPDGRLCSVEGNVGDAVRGVVRPRDAWTYYARPIPIQ